MNKIIQTTIILLSMFIITFQQPTLGKDKYKIIDKDYLEKVNTIRFNAIDTVKSFNDTLNPQSYYLNLFLTVLGLGINGHTNYEVLEYTSTTKPDLVFNFKLLELKAFPKDTLSTYKTRFSVEVCGINPSNNKTIVTLKMTRTSHTINQEDELEDNILETTDNLIDFFAEQKVAHMQKSFYVNKLSCKELKNKKINYLFLANPKDPFQDKLIDVLDAELIQYFYTQKIKIQHLNNPTDSFILNEYSTHTTDSLLTTLSPASLNALKQASVDYLLTIENTTVFQTSNRPSTSSTFGMLFIITPFFPMVIPVPSATSFISTGSNANLEELNAYNRIYCTLNLIDVNTGDCLLKNHLYIYQNDMCEDPERCLGLYIKNQLFEINTKNGKRSYCY